MGVAIYGSPTGRRLAINIIINCTPRLYSKLDYCQCNAVLVRSPERTRTFFLSYSIFMDKRSFSISRDTECSRKHKLPYLSWCPVFLQISIPFPPNRENHALSGLKNVDAFHSSTDWLVRIHYTCASFIFIGWIINYVTVIQPITLKI